MAMNAQLPDADVVQWAVTNCLSGDLPGEEEMVDHLIGAIAGEAEAACAPLSEAFLTRLRIILGEELMVRLGERFSERLRRLCAEEKHERLIDADWTKIGF